MQPHFSAATIDSFEDVFDSTREGSALVARARFLKRFPRKRLATMTLDDYVIGKRRDSFCFFVEPETRAWAVIQGATAMKFGIYYGKTKQDPSPDYRFVKGLGKSPQEALGSIKLALIDLLAAGQSLNFKAIDESILSPMFRAKILSLYFPELYISVCSGSLLEDLAKMMKLPAGLSPAELQNRLMQIRVQDKRTQAWSNPKFARFLLWKLLLRKYGSPSAKLGKPKNKNQTVDFEAMEEARRERGRNSEKFALQWEKDRLRGFLPHLIGQIQDRRRTPRYGYDFDSFSTAKRPRHIEVKSVGVESGGLRFFLSTNEDRVAQSKQYGQNYYFYLVHYDKKGVPERVEVQKASTFLQRCVKDTACWIVRFKAVP